MKQRLVILCIGGLLAACTPPQVISSTPTATDPPAGATLTATWPPGECAFVEESRALPESGERVQAALAEAGLPIVRVDTWATGESCVAPNPADSRPFSPRDLSLTLTFALEQPYGQEGLGNLLADTLTVLTGLPYEAAPNWQQGTLTMAFESETGYLEISYPPDALRQLLERHAQGVRGAALYAPTVEPCAFMWATEPLPDLSAQVQAALEEAGITNAVARAEAFGENCVQADGTVQGFSAIETDFSVEIEVADLNDREALGEQAAAVLAVLMQFPPDMPGGLGRIRLVFVAGDEQFGLAFGYETAQEAVEEGVTGAALIERLEEAEPL